jgi:predicted alpha/beta hydrolase family esterase
MTFNPSAFRGIYLYFPIHRRLAMRQISGYSPRSHAMTEYVILPGIGGSGDAHWQSAWQRQRKDMYRFSPRDWDEPERQDWVQALEAAVSERRSPCVLVAHSLACLLVAHWSLASSTKVLGAFLVAVPDPQGPAFPQAAADFAPVPEIPLRFPSLIVASSDDPYASLEYAQARARQWGSSLVVAGPRGHINGQSKLGQWQEGLDLLQSFTAEARQQQGPGRPPH